MATDARTHRNRHEVAETNQISIGGLMFSETDLMREVTDEIENCLALDRPVQAAWLTNKIVGSHSRITGDDKEFYTLCAYEHVRDTVRQALRKYRPELEDTPDPR